MGDVAERDQKYYKEEGDRLYEEYGKSLEAEHWGEYVAITPDGRVFLADTRYDAAKQAHDAFGPGIHLFKVGEKAVGKWR